MKRKLIVLLSALVVTLPLAVFAGSMHEHGEQGTSEGMMHGEHEGMMMQGDMIMLGEQVEDGVKAMAHLKDVKEAMAKMGMDATHHIMILFVDAATGEPIEEGMVAVKITDPSGSTGEPVKLMGMQGHFGADIVLKEKGEYKFEIGTKLKDGKKRQFEFTYTVG